MIREDFESQEAFEAWEDAFWEWLNKQPSAPSVEQGELNYEDFQFGE